MTNKDTVMLLLSLIKQKTGWKTDNKIEDYSDSGYSVVFTPCPLGHLIGGYVAHLPKFYLMAKLRISWKVNYNCQRWRIMNEEEILSKLEKMSVSEGCKR